MPKPRTSAAVAALVAAAALIAVSCTPPPPAQLPLARPGHTPKVMVLGDSMAVDLAPAVRSEAGALRYRPYAQGVIGCVAGGSVMVGNAPLQQQCFTYRASWPNLVARERPDVVVLVRQSLVAPGGGVPGAHRCDPRYLEWFKARLREDVAAVSGTGATVVLTTSPYARFAGVVNTHEDNLLDCTNRAIRDVAATAPRAALVDLATWVCPTRQCHTHIGGVNVRPDGLHFRDAGARLAMRHLMGSIYK